MASGDTKTEQLLDILENGGDTSKIVGCCNTNLQNYLVESINSLNDAKEKIEEKGGTVGDTGLSGLAEEIDSIPSGGDGDWGTVTYLDDNNEEHTVNIQDAYEYSTLGQYSLNQGDPLIASNVTIPKDKVTKVAFGKSATFAPYSFMYNANSLIELANTENLVYIGDSFLSNCSAFNQSLNLENVTHIANNFLYACSSFNSPITMPKVVTIGNWFLRSCTSYNKAIDMPDSLITIGNNFLYGCSTFNSALDLGSVEKIGNNFMYDCTAFAQSLTIPQTILDESDSVGTYFMYNCNNFVGPLVCDAPTINAALTSSTQTLSTTDNTAPMYTTGVTLTGPYANIWKTKYSNRTSSPYRKLIVGS